jgi:hypothetical protein
MGDRSVTVKPLVWPPRVIVLLDELLDEPIEMLVIEGDDPVHGRHLGHVEVKNPTATVIENNEDVEDAEGSSRHGAEVDSPVFIEMIAKKGQPGL